MFRYRKFKKKIEKLEINLSNLPSTVKKAVHDIPPMSIVYLPVSSTLGVEIISWYESSSFLNLYFDDGNNSWI